ncbi:hypothetical protein ACFX1T_022892 [Malus domestica]
MGRDGTGQNGTEQMFYVMFEHRHCYFFIFIFHSLLLPSKPNIHRHPFSSLTHHNPPSPPSPHLVSKFSRILNDHMNPHHDLELSLNALSTQISTDLVEQVLKRCKNLGLSAHSYLEALCKGGKVDEAYKIFREMGSNGVEPDACTYSIFIRTYCEVDDLPPFMLSSTP